MKMDVLILCPSIKHPDVNSLFTGRYEQNDKKAVRYKLAANMFYINLKRIICLLFCAFEFFSAIENLDGEIDVVEVAV